MADSDSTTDIRKVIDFVSQTTGIGTLSSSYYDLLSGFNHRSVGSPIPVNVDQQGITFFTRPNMNLSGDNLVVDRVLTPLLTNNPMTYQRVIRAMLDPLGNVFDTLNDRKITTPLFDHRQAFMPLLTNGLKSLSGWPDIALDTYTSKEGVLRENLTLMDGTHRTYSSFDLSATFRNYGGDPITLLLLIWAVYMSLIHRGDMTPYLRSVVTNRVDYHTRIFRFTMDPSRTRIQKWGSAMGCFPVGVPIGASLNFSDNQPYLSENAEEVSVSFKAQGAEYMDPILFAEFNDLVGLFNPGMIDSDDKGGDGVRTQAYTKVDYQYLRLFNYRGFPHINERTSELEWWVDNAVYNDRKSSLDALQKAGVYTPPPAPSSGGSPALPPPTPTPTP